jgi:hypothetical protein
MDMAVLQSLKGMNNMFAFWDKIPNLEETITTTTEIERDNDETMFFVNGPRGVEQSIARNI